MRSSTVSPESSEPYSPTANEFPRQAGALIRLPRDGNGFLSPSPSSLSFDESRSTPISDLGEEKQILRKTGRGAPGDASLSTMVRREHENNSSLSRRKSQFYGEVFAYRESNISARNKIHQYSVITAEVKTNVIVRPPDHLTYLDSLANAAHRCKTNPYSSRIYPSISPNATTAPSLQYSSHWPTRSVLSMPAPSTQRIYSQSPHSHHKSNPQPTSGTRL